MVMPLTPGGCWGIDELELRMMQPCTAVTRPKKGCLAKPDPLPAKAFRSHMRRVRSLEEERRMWGLVG